MVNNQVKESNVLDLVTWLCSKPVQKFSFDGCYSWEHISIAVRQKFYEAMVNCPTMDELTLNTTGANGLDFSKFTFSMRSLDIWHPNCHFIESMAGRLEGSRVTDLKIFGCHAREKSAYEALLEVLPKTSMKSLRWHNIKLDQEHWREFVPLLAKCPVERLTLCIEKLHSEIAQSIAMALEQNESICELDLTGSTVAMKDFEPLIKSMTHPSRPVKKKRSKWMQRHRHAVRVKPLAMLKQLVEDRGGEFLF
ncbi:hypothetical protein AC1031_005857 [Aphanomyces cochlioides]|nr:hypothetical protein AC1031_005857 [Aphanomyces cochlioides]